MANHPNRSRTVYARRISGNLYDVTTSYDSTLDKMSRQEVEALAKGDHAGRIEFDNSAHRGVGEADSETVRLR